MDISKNGLNKKTKDKGYGLFRLVSSEYIIAKIIGSSKDKYFLDRPMAITGFTSMGGVSGLGMTQKQYVCLNNWMEFGVENTIQLEKNFVMVVVQPEDNLAEAYDKQKEYEDMDGMVDIVNIDDIPLDEILGENGMSDLVNKIMNDVTSNGRISFDSGKEESNEEDWDIRDIDTTRDDYGCHLEDWSPYIEDYLGDIDDAPPSSHP